jgi:DNA modification methylase
MTVRLLPGDCRSVLGTLPAASVQCVVTSPPYYGLRDYGVANQIGLEPSPDEYLATMVAVFREVRRVLRDDGTCWVNMGDSYWNGGGEKRDGGHGFVDGGKTKLEAARGTLLQAKCSAPGYKPKDLLMMPARLALALQAPDYLGRIRKETDRSWLAGLVDGEGCITILEATSPHGSGSSYPPVLQVRMCDVECVAKAAEITGLGLTEPPQEAPSLGGNRGSYQWRLNGRKAADTIAEIYPFLLVKRKQAIVAWNHQAVRDSYETKRGVRIPAAAVEKQRLCRDLIQRLNSREPVDLPSWMIEPPLPIGPGWYLRSDVIWHKPNPMPESVTDRPTSAHEHVFLLTKRATYYYDADAVREAADMAYAARYNSSFFTGTKETNGAGRPDAASNTPGRLEFTGTRNLRNVWTIATAPYAEAHFATFPPALAERCIKAGTSDKGCCGQCGAPWGRVVERTAEATVRAPPSVYTGAAYASPQSAPRGPKSNFGESVNATTGWAPGCRCDAPVVPCTVLDPFAGAGTTLLVADRLQRNAIGIELNPEYTRLAMQRCHDDAPLFTSWPPAEDPADARMADLFQQAAD